MTFQELAQLVGAPSGTHQAELTHVSAHASASAASIVFASDAKTLAAALLSSAGAVLFPAKLLPFADDPRLIPVRDARYAFALVAFALRSKSVEPYVHPTAVIAAGASIGRGTQIGPYAVIEEGVRIGAHSVIGARVTIHTGTALGDHVVVQAGAVLGSTGFGYAHDPETGTYLLFPQQGTLVIADDVEIGANTTIDRGALGETRIGRGTKIDNLVHVGHNCVIGEDVIIAAQTGISGSSIVEDGAILGGQVGIGEHATVGAGVILGGGAGVLSNKKMHGPGQVFWGRPARPLKEYLRDLARLRGGKPSSPLD